MTSLALLLTTREAGRRRLGLLTRPELLACGVTDREIVAALRCGELHRVRRGAFVTTADLAEVE